MPRTANYYIYKAITKFQIMWLQSIHFQQLFWELHSINSVENAGMLTVESLRPNFVALA